MNDKCAGGTGAVIDKISINLNLDGEALKNSRYWGMDLHPVAGKCGVFAETDITAFRIKASLPTSLWHPCTRPLCSKT